MLFLIKILLSLLIISSLTMLFWDPKKYLTARKIFELSEVYGNEIKLGEYTHLEVKELDTKFKGCGVDISVSFVCDGKVLETIEDRFMDFETNYFKGPWRKEISNKIKMLDKEIKNEKKISKLAKKNQINKTNKNNIEFYNQKRAN